ncbi:hypothetical protein L195_g062952, partial [Trifolium pratense]
AVAVADAAVVVAATRNAVVAA